MGRHSRRGAEKAAAKDEAAAREAGAGRAEGARRPVPGGHSDATPGRAEGLPVRPVPWAADGQTGRATRPRIAEAASHQGGNRPSDGPPHRGGPRYPDGADGTPPHGTPRLFDGTPADGTPRLFDDTPADWTPRLFDGTPPHGVPRLADGTPPYGVPGFPDGGTPARGVPRFQDGDAPARGARRFPDGTPAHGVPRFGDDAPPRGTARFADGAAPARGVSNTADGAPAQGGLPGGAPARGTLSAGTPPHGTPRVRGGHPEQREPGGGWGDGGAGRGSAAGPAIPGQRHVSPHGPRQEYVDAFDEGDALEEGDGPASRRADPFATATAWHAESGAPSDADGGAEPPTGTPAQNGGKGRAFTGIAAAAVTTVLAVVVAGQVADGREDGDGQALSTAGKGAGALRGDGRPMPSTSPSAVPLTYAQKMARTYPLGAELEGSGEFAVIPGTAKGPAKGEKFTYRVDVERGLGLDGALFADAVQKTLNDDRSWAHDGDRSFDRVASDDPDFVITLASPGTTADWCAKSGLDTTQDNVSCDSASTERVMINAYRWAQGSTTYGDRIYPYRQMLINHEVGHRLGYSHENCENDGELAPVMQQQTKFLDHDGIHCKANAWPYPKS